LFVPTFDALLVHRNSFDTLREESCEYGWDTNTNTALLPGIGVGIGMGVGTGSGTAVGAGRRGTAVGTGSGTTVGAGTRAIGTINVHAAVTHAIAASI
jgi:hypothetical protein